MQWIGLFAAILSFSEYYGRIPLENFVIYVNNFIGVR